MRAAPIIFELACGRLIKLRTFNLRALDKEIVICDKKCKLPLPQMRQTQKVSIVRLRWTFSYSPKIMYISHCSRETRVKSQKWYHLVHPVRSMCHFLVVQLSVRVYLLPKVQSYLSLLEFRSQSINIPVLLLGHRFLLSFFGILYQLLSQFIGLFFLFL